MHLAFVFYISEDDQMVNRNMQEFIV